VSSIEFTFAFVPKAASHGVIGIVVYKSVPFSLYFFPSSIFILMYKSPFLPPFLPSFPCPIKRIFSPF